MRHQIQAIMLSIYMNSAKNITYQAMSESDFQAVIELGNLVHGSGYVNEQEIVDWHKKGLKDGINCSYVAYDGDKLVGFRITYSPGTWQTDQWYSPELWKTKLEDTAYFKCNTVDEHYRGYGIGSKLLSLSKESLMAQGAKSGVSHLWRQSPGNSAVLYFSKCGGELVKDHPGKWYEDSVNGYDCTICGHDCDCVAAEMIIYF